MVAVRVNPTVLEACDPNFVCRITQVTSNEPVNGLGDGDQEPDWQITGLLNLNLRSERSGTGSGRTYTITVVCSDASGNSSSANVTVQVPRDQSP